MSRRMNTKKGQKFVARIKQNLADLYPYVRDGKEMLARIRTYRAFRHAAEYMGKSTVLFFVKDQISSDYFKIQ